MALKIDPTINYGALLQIGAVIATVSGALAISGSDTKQVERQVSRLEASITSLEKRLESLPDFSVRLVALERRQDQIDNRVAALDVRVGSLERLGFELRVMIDNIARSSQVPLPGDKVK